MRKVIVIGGGAAGLMAAGQAALTGKKVLLLEKMDRVGRKILITGKGRCNITNATDIEGIINNTPGNGSFLYSTLYRFSNQDIIDFFENSGVPLKIERGGRIFPESDQAKDIVDALKNFAIKQGVEIYEKAKVMEILTNNQRATGIKLDNGRTMEANSVVLATGGASYSATGSSGDGYKMAKQLGHKVTELKPALVPLVSDTPWVKELMGLSLRNVNVEFSKAGKKIYQEFGEMLFTHYGVSGPIVLSGSRHLLPYDFKGIEMKIDLKPALDEQKLDDRILRDFQKYANKHFCNSLNDLLPQKLIPVIVKLSGIPAEKTVNQISKTERRNLLQLIQGLTLNINGSRPMNEAIVTAGGVVTNEINPSSMESKLIGGLFFAGEVIDVDAYTGGFNLTIALSTGYTAGVKA